MSKNLVLACGEVLAAPSVEKSDDNGLVKFEGVA